MLRHRGGGTPEPDNGPTSTAQHDRDALGMTMIDRVTDLERALAIAKEEQASLREDMSKAQENQQTDHSTIEGLRQQLAEIRPNTGNASSGAASNVRGANDTHKTGQGEDAELLRQNYELRYRIALLEDQLTPPGRARESPEQSKPRGEVGELRMRLHATEKESQERLQQLMSLKSSISSLTRMHSQATDGDLVESFSQLANRVREWTVSNFRRLKPNFDNLPKETEDTLRALCPHYMTGIQGADRLALYQAIISNSLMQIFDSPLIFGLSSTGSLAIVQSFAEQVHDGGTAYGQWKRATIQVLECSKAQHDLKREREQSLHRLLGEICHLLFTLTSTTVPLPAQSTLDGILKDAVDLQRTLALQKARYQLLFFRGRDTKMHLDDRTMEAVNNVDSGMDDDTDMETDRTFLFCAIPGLIKHGNEWGEHLEISNVLLKARVCSGFG